MQKKRQKPLSARDHEKIEVIINATCQYFSIERAVIGMPGKACTKIRRICFFLISKNTDISSGHIAELFNKNKAQSSRGIELISVHAGIYATLSQQIADIAQICNKFEPKLYQWHIQH